MCSFSFWQIHAEDISRQFLGADRNRDDPWTRQRISYDPCWVGMIFFAGAMTTLNAALEGKGDSPPFSSTIYMGQGLRFRSLSMRRRCSMPSLWTTCCFGSRTSGWSKPWHDANRPVELHAYECSNHGFGIGFPGTTSTGVLPQFTE